jgi:hypothetical protein
MTPSAILYAAADYTREHGFSPELGEPGGPRCLFGSLQTVARMPPREWSTLDAWLSAENILGSITGSDVSVCRLQRDGWNTDDAVAALTIAADIAFEDERAEVQP